MDYKHTKEDKEFCKNIKICNEVINCIKDQKNVRVSDCVKLSRSTSKKILKKCLNK